MSPDIAERAFEGAIEQALLKNGPDDPDRDTSGIRERELEVGEFVPGGYQKRLPSDYDRALCLIPRDVVNFIYATQPNEWEKLKSYHGADVKERFLKRLSSEISKRGALDVFRKGVKDSGCRFRLAFFRPASGLNEEIQQLYEGNLFSIVRQLHYSEKNEKSLDLALFLNGIPIFTAELKSPLTGQNVEHAINQYRYDRDSREPLFIFRRCLAHFAVDPDLIYVTTHLRGPKTSFLPFNQGKFGGAGNPPKSPTDGGYATDYLWNRVWSRDSVLNLI
jgi:type I restriction enzyme R subunit